MKKWLASTLVLTALLTLGSCCWPYYHHGYPGDRSGYDYHDRGRDHNWDHDRYKY